MYDAIVVGARCAGSPTAMLLARKGYKVLLLDRASFPSDTLSTHYVQLPGAACLARWGLLERLRDSGCPPVKNFVFDFGPVTLRGSPPAVDGQTEGFCPRRKVLDKILVDAALEAGVELREGFAVTDIIDDGEGVRGVHGQSRRGSNVVERARIVIGADGPHSIVARTVKAKEYSEHPAGEVSYYSYFSGVSIEGTELYPRDYRLFGAFPTHDGLACIFANRPHAEFHAYRANIEGGFFEALKLAPAFYERVRAGKREERFVGTAETRNFFRKPYGPGWALVGDAGYHKSPCLGQGIADAFRDAEVLAEAIDDGLNGRRPLEEALVAYERKRNDTVMPIYELTCELARMEPPSPEMQALLAAVRGNQSDIDAFIGANTDPDQTAGFFAPVNVQRIVGAT